MSTYTQILYHLVFSTRNRKPVLHKEHRDRLYRYMTGTIIKHKCMSVCIGGTEDHVHILTHLHPAVSLSSLVKDIKVSSTLFIRESGIFPGFDNWQEGYAAFMHSWSNLEGLIRYVKAQEEHHRKVPFKDELRNLLKEHDIPFEEKYL